MRSAIFSADEIPQVRQDSVVLASLCGSYPRTVVEIGRELRNPVEAVDARVRLDAAGLLHRCRDVGGRAFARPCDGSLAAVGVRRAPKFAVHSLARGDDRGFECVVMR